MNIEMAIDELSSKKEKYENMVNAINIAISALEKQIPFKPEHYKGFYGQCKCRAIFLDKLTEYCGNCGQKLDWSEVKE